MFVETGPLVFITFRQMVALHTSAAESAGFFELWFTPCRSAEAQNNSDTLQKNMCHDTRFYFETMSDNERFRMFIEGW